MSIPPPPPIVTRPLMLSGGYMDSLSDISMVVHRFKRFINDELYHERYDFETGHTENVPVKSPEFDTVIATGVSGLMVLSQFAEAANCNWLAIRKDRDGSHSSVKGEGKLGSRWLFVDDFISSGMTLARVAATVSLIASRNRHRTEFMGAYQYERYSTSPFVDASGCCRTHLAYYVRESNGGIKFDYNAAVESNRTSVAMSVNNLIDAAKKIGDISYE